MTKPSEDLLLAYGRVAWGYNQVRTAQSLGRSAEPEYIAIRDQLRQDRINLEKMQKEHGDKPYQHK